MLPCCALSKTSPLEDKYRNSHLLKNIMPLSGRPPDGMEYLSPFRQQWRCIRILWISKGIFVSSLNWIVFIMLFLFVFCRVGVAAKSRLSTAMESQNTAWKPCFKFVSFSFLGESVSLKRSYTLIIPHSARNCNRWERYFFNDLTENFYHLHGICIEIFLDIWYHNNEDGSRISKNIFIWLSILRFSTGSIKKLTERKYFAHQWPLVTRKKWWPPWKNSNSSQHFWQLSYVLPPVPVIRPALMT